MLSQTGFTPQKFDKSYITLGDYKVRWVFARTGMLVFCDDTCTINLDVENSYAHIEFNTKGELMLAIECINGLYEGITLDVFRDISSTKFLCYYNDIKQGHEPKLSELDMDLLTNGFPFVEYDEEPINIPGYTFVPNNSDNVSHIPNFVHKKQFEKEHIELHKEWTANVGKPDYNKQTFRDKEKELNRKFR